MLIEYIFILILLYNLNLFSGTGIIIAGVF